MSLLAYDIENFRAKVVLPVILKLWPLSLLCCSFFVHSVGVSFVSVISYFHRLHTVPHDCVGVSHSPLSFACPGFMHASSMSHCSICQRVCHLQGLWEVPLAVWWCVPECAAFLFLVQPSPAISFSLPSGECFFIPCLTTFMTGTVILNAQSYIWGAKLKNYGVCEKWKIL